LGKRSRHEDRSPLPQSAALFPPRLIEAARSRGHEIDTINHLRCTIDIASHRPKIHYHGKVLPKPDAVIPRIGASVTFFGTAVVRQFEMMRVYCVNESVSISRSRDKLRSLQLLVAQGHRPSGHGFRAQDVECRGYREACRRRAGGDQAAGRDAGHRRGAGRDAQSGRLDHRGVRRRQHQHPRPGICAGSEGGGPSLHRHRRQGRRIDAARGREGDFRSNLHRGGSAKAARITPQERATAIGAARAMGLNVCGVDMLRSNHGPVVMEVNSSPGLEGIESATGVDVAGKIIEFIEKNAKPGNTKTRGKG
jgi:ribosomal protein S6--L-glutamate ligase